MKCPSCGQEQDENNIECEKCQIIFEKWAKRHEAGVSCPPAVQGKTISVFMIAVHTIALFTLLFFAFKYFSRPETPPVQIASANNFRLPMSNRKQADLPSQNTSVPRTVKKSANRVEPAVVKTDANGQNGALVSSGEEVDLLLHLEKGKVTIFDFYADWCGPCKQLSPQLEELAAANPDIVIKKINIQTWGTPVTKQYGIRGIPYIRVYDKKGQLAGDVMGCNISQIKKLAQVK